MALGSSTGCWLASTIAVLVAAWAVYRTQPVSTAVSDLLQYSAKSVVVHVASIATKTRVELESAYVSMTSGKAGLIGLSVGVPDGFIYPAAHMPAIEIEFEADTLISRSLIVATKVSVHKPAIVYEMRERGSSVQAVFESIKQYHADSMPPFIVIRELHIGEGTIEIILGDRADSRKVRSPALHLTNLGVASLGLSFSGMFKLVADPLIENLLATVEAALAGAQANATSAA